MTGPRPAVVSESQPETASLRFFDAVTGTAVALLYVAGRWTPERIGLSLAPFDWLMSAPVIASLLGGLSLVAQASVPPDQKQAKGLAGARLPVAAGLLLLWGVVVRDAVGGDLLGSDSIAFEVASVALTMGTISMIARRRRAGGHRVVVVAAWATAVALALLTISGWAQLLAGAGAARLATLGGGPNVFGRHMATLGVVAMWFLLRPPSMIRRRLATGLASALLVSSLVLLARSGSRASLLGFALGGLAVVLLERTSIRRLGSLLFAGTGSLVAASLLFPEQFGGAVDDLNTRIIQLTLQDRYTGRAEVFDDALQCVSEAGPFGGGTTAFADISSFAYPHNLLLEGTCTGGWIGGVLALLFIAAFIVSLGKRRDSCRSLLTGLFMVLLSSAMFSGDLFDSRGLFLLTAIALAWTPESPEPHPDTSSTKGAAPQSSTGPPHARNESFESAPTGTTST